MPWPGPIATQLEAIPDPQLLLAGIFTHAPVALELIDRAGRVVAANEAFAALFGAELPEGYCLLRDEVALARGDVARFERALAGETVHVPTAWSEAREVGRLSSPQRVAISVTYFPLRDRASTISHVVLAYRDHTETERAREAAEAGERKLQKLAAQSLDIILLLDRDHTIRYAAPSTAHVLGLTSESQLDRPFSELLHPDDLNRTREELARASASPGTRITTEHRVRHLDSTYRTMEVAIVDLCHDGDVGAIVVSQHDVTSRKHAEDERQRMGELETRKRRADDRLRAKSEFFSTMSHELRTPLNAIIGFAEILHDGQVTSDSSLHAEFLGDILSSGRHLLELINDVLDLARADAGALDFRPERFPHARAVAEVCTLLRPTSAERHIRIELDCDEALDSVRIDPIRFRQVLYVYLSNALKFTPDGGHVRIRTRILDDERFVLEVADDGIGISPAELENVFVEFTQIAAKTLKDPHGSGVGLALTKRLVEAQGGSVSVTSTLGSGSTFYAVLPRAHGEPVVQRPPSLTPSSIPRPGARVVLVVEDDSRDLAMLARTLSDAGYAVETAKTGAEAIAKCGTMRFDAVTLDLILPDASGLDVLGEIRKTASHENVPVVVVTIVAEKQSYLAFSVQEVLAKPLDRGELLRALERANVPPDREGGVLVIDDDPISRKLVEMTLGQLGYTTIARSSAEEGLDALHKLSPSAVVLDLLMPGMNGFEFLERLRALPTHAHTPVLVWSAKHLSQAERERLRSTLHAGVASSKTGGGNLLGELRAFMHDATQETHS